MCDVALELGVMPDEAGEIELTELSKLLARMQQRQRAEDLKWDARFIGLCTAILAERIGEPFDARDFYFSLRGEGLAGGIEDDELMEQALMGWATAAQSAANRTQETL